MSSEGNKPKLQKVGVLKVKNGKYVKDGRELNRYHEVGVVFATPHHSRLAIKFHNTQNGEGQWSEVFWDAPQNDRAGGADSRKPAQDGEVPS